MKVLGIMSGKVAMNNLPEEDFAAGRTLQVPMRSQRLLCGAFLR